MRLAWVVLAGGAVLLLTACPYHGTVPVGPVQPGLFDQRLLGEWDAGKPGEFLPTRLWIARFDADQYVVTGIGDCPNPGGRGHLTRVGEHLFLNVKEEGGEGRYRIARVDFDGPQLVLRQLTDSLDRVTTSDSLRARVLARVEDPATYVGAVTYRRTRAPVADTGAAAIAQIQRACYYDAAMLLENPEPDSVLDFLLGRWRFEQGDSVTMEVSRKVGGHIRITNVAATSELTHDSTVINLEVYATRLGDALFLNAAEPERENNTISRVFVRGDTLELRMLNAGINAESPAALRRIVTERRDDPAIYYWEPLRLVRVR